MTDTIDDLIGLARRDGDRMTTHAPMRLTVDDAMWEMRSDGRSVRGRIVPFNEVVTVYDRGKRIREQFLPGCVDRLCQVVAKRGNAAFIKFNLDHDESFEREIGYAATLQTQGDGAWADFRLLPGRDLDKVRAMLAESHTGLSVLFDDIVPPREIDGVRSRVQVLIEHVAATPWAVYEGARIMTMRDGVSDASMPTIDEIDERPALAEWQQYLDTLHPTT